MKTHLKKNIIQSTKINPPFVLMILDGFGLANVKNKGNAITPETAPNIFSYIKKYSFTKLKASGVDVGLFPNQEGNSEAGHFNIGGGRIVEQDLVRISDDISSGIFFKNHAFKHALFHAKKYKSNVHVMGLLTDDQSPHARPEHLYALLEFFRREKYSNHVYLHLFTDGRDSPPHSAIEHLKDLRKYMIGGEKIATVIGRFYAMDRNKDWKRTEATYDAMTCGKAAQIATSAEEAISQAYNRGEMDEHIQPTVIVSKGTSVTTIKDNDVLYFFNARSDRARQITKTFVQQEPLFHKENPGIFTRKHFPKNTRFVAMTDFGPDLPGIFTAFPSPDVKNSLAKAIGEARKQLYISETQKYAHVTYFINGGYPKPINGEKRELIRSPAVYSYADRPGMESGKITKRIIDHFNKKEFNFICVNYPNADMVGHTGNIEAAKQGIHIMDANVKTVVDFILSHDGTLLITADHGNAECMIDPKTGGMLTEHTTNPVPFILIRKGVKKKLRVGGRLSDIAPTILDMLHLTKPNEMTGTSLLV